MQILARLSQRAQAEASGGTTKVWAEIMALAKPGVVNLGQGFPDFPGHPVAREAAQEALAGGTHDQYSPIPGSVRLRRAIAELYARMYPDTVPTTPDGAARPLDPMSEVCVMTSGTEAVYCALLSLVDPGDEVVFFEPCFPWYAPCIRMAGGVPKPVALPPPTFDLAPAEAAVREAFSPRTKVCIFNTPHNPTGRVASRAELALIAELCREHDVLCVSDEVYEGCAAPPPRAPAASAACPGWLTPPSPPPGACTPGARTIGCATRRGCGIARSLLDRRPSSSHSPAGASAGHTAPTI